MSRDDQRTKPFSPATDVERPTVAIQPANVELSEDVIGVGGMGIVYRATQTDLARPVAFKRLVETTNEELRARFVREAQLTAQLDHPSIVPVHLFAQDGYAMKLVEGKTLARLIEEAWHLVDKGEPLDDEHALETRLEHFVKVCDAIAFAHDRQIIHRDLKPSNVMIGTFGAVYVMDWGIARPIGSTEIATTAQEQPRPAELTRAGAVIGSVPYMSPEQARGKNAELDGRSDQYSLGLLLYELVALTPALTGPTEKDVYEAAARGRKAPLDTVAGKPAHIPRELRAIVDRATALDPRRRYATVRELSDDVRRFLRNEAVLAFPERGIARLLRLMSRHRRATLSAFVGVVALAALAVIWTRYRNVASELATRQRGARLTAVYGEVARQAHTIDGELFKLEHALEGLSTASEWALVGPEPAEARVYLDADFKDPARRPADFTTKTAYRWPVSTDFPVVGLAPGLDAQALMPQIRRIAQLRDHIRHMVAAAAVGDATVLTDEQLRPLLLSRKSPIDYAYVDLPAGVHMVWPGVDALPPDYDVRTSSFYKMSERKRGKRWGSPYVDATTDRDGDDLVLPCTQGLWSPTGEFLGVAGVEITVTKLVETRMKLPGRTTLRASLVDRHGRVIVDSRDANKRFVANGRDEAVEFVDFDISRIANEIRAGKEGLREVSHAGRNTVVAFVRLDAIGWYYVVELDGV